MSITLTDKGKAGGIIVLFILISLFRAYNANAGCDAAFGGELWYCIPGSHMDEANYVYHGKFFWNTSDYGRCVELGWCNILEPKTVMGFPVLAFHDHAPGFKYFSAVWGLLGSSIMWFRLSSILICALTLALVYQETKSLRSVGVLAIMLSLIVDSAMFYHNPLHMLLIFLAFKTRKHRFSFVWGAAAFLVQDLLSVVLLLIPYYRCLRHYFLSLFLGVVAYNLIYLYLGGVTPLGIHLWTFVFGGTPSSWVRVARYLMPVYPFMARWFK